MPSPIGGTASAVTVDRTRDASVSTLGEATSLSGVAAAKGEALGPRLSPPSAALDRFMGGLRLTAADFGAADTAGLAARAASLRSGDG